jgi:hydroxyacylglutathione hydrolase
MREKAFDLACFALGMFQTNCYVIWPSDAKSGTGALIIDPGQWPDGMIKFVKEKGLTPEKVVLTHAHADHIMGLHEVRQAWPGIPIVIHPLEKAFLTDPVLNLSAMFGEPFVGPEATGFLEEGDKLEFAGKEIEVFHTPGHSPGSICLYMPFQRMVIGGDVLFREGIGRTDFPGGSFEVLQRSIREKLYTLPDDTTVYPGHGTQTTTGWEKKSNGFVRG